MRTLPQPEITPHIEARFWRLVDRSGDCWEWKGGTWESGYGVFKIKIEGKWKRYKAHRISFLIAHGKMPDNHGCHSCDNPPCCNPAHIFDGTQADNQHDMKVKGRAAKGKRSGRYTKPESNPVGERNGNAILTELQVVEIRRRYARPAYRVSNALDLAVEFGVPRHVILQVVARRTWKHVPEHPH